jgi:putative hydrolase of the HAD superfamily
VISEYVEKYINDKRILSSINSDLIEQKLDRRKNNLLANLFYLVLERYPSYKEHEDLFYIYCYLNRQIKPYKHAYDVLLYTKKIGINILATNGIKRVQENKINYLSLKDVFDYVIILEDKEYQKPNPTKILELIDKINKDRKHITVIGDDPINDINFGKSLNATTIRIKKGFFKNEVTPLSDYEINELYEIFEILNKEALR